MRKVVLSTLVGFAFFASTAVAQEFDTNPLGDGAYTCNFLPTDTIRAGYVYRVKDILKFPAGPDEKLFDVERKFQVEPGAGGTTGTVAGVRTKTVSKVKLKAAAELFGKPDVDLGGNASRRVEIERGVDNHSVHKLSDSDIVPVIDWFKLFKSSSGYKKGWKYYLVREIRYADGMYYSVTKDVAAKLGGEGTLTKVADVEIVAQTESTKSIELQTKFAKPSVFCMVVERLK